MVAIIGIIAVVGMALQGTFIYCEYKDKQISADVFKGLASLCFVMIGLLAYLPQAGSYSLGLKILLGLVFGLIGDVVMNLRFILKGDAGQKAFLGGILAFLIGHILYLLALIPYTTHLIWCIVIGCVISAGLLTYIFTTMEVKIAFKIFGIFYLTAVIVMTVIAIDLAIVNPNCHNLMYAIGAVLFTASDIILIFNTFGGESKFFRRITNLSLYYIGQLLIAGSLFF